MADPVSLAITAALTAAQMALQASQKIEGPRLDDLSVTVADYGTPLNYFYGTRRFEGIPIIWAEPLREVKKKRKTKGGKYSEYTYYATFAVAVANHQIDGITRIWFDKHLVYDATGAGPISPFALGKKARSITEYLRIYLGTETQMPDPRMLATVEKAHGAGSCPAYRGTSYVVFEELPVEKFGNRIPQIMVEAVAQGAPAYPYETFDYVTGKPTNIILDPSGNYMAWGGQTYEVYDLLSRSLLGSPTFSVPVAGDTKGITSNGVIYSILPNPDWVDAFFNGNHHVGAFDAASGALLTSSDTGGRFQDGCVVLADGNGTEHCLTYGFTSWAKQYETVVDGEVVGSAGWQEFDFGWKITQYFTDSYGDIWAVGSLGTGTTTMYLRRVVDTGARPGSPGSASFTVPAGGAYWTHVDGAHYDGHFVLQWGGSALYLIDDETLTVVDSRSYGYAYATANWLYHDPNQSTIWLGQDEISLTDLSTVRTIDYTDWKFEDVYFNTSAYIPALHALIGSPQFGSVFTLRYLDRLGSNGITLGDIANDVAGRCGLGAYDFSALDQVIHGYNWTQGAGRDILDPLFDAHDSDIVPHDFTVRGIKRGSASGGTIDVSDFVKGDSRYKVAITQDADLPRALTFSFADLAAEQQTNSVLVQRPVGSVDGVRELSINFTTLALGVDEARQLAERYLRRKWFGREKIENAVTAQQLDLEPGDVRTLVLDGINRKVRLTEQTLSSDGSIKCVWERDDATIATLSGATGAAMDGRVPSVMLVPSPSQGFFLDVPLARDGDDQATPFLSLAAGPFAESTYWPGADIYQSEDGSADSYASGWASIGALDAATWGFATTALGDALPWVPDNGNSLTLDLRSGDLESLTDAEFDASTSTNLALVESPDGWEYLRFRTATLNGDGTWTISGLDRGCRGTEQHIAGHAIGNRFLLVDASVQKKSLSASEIGDTDYYKAVSQGRDESSAFPQSTAFTAAAQKPYSPVHGELTLDSGSGDWSIDAVRRTRIGGANIDGGDVPLGETAESWSCDILDGAVVVRTITGSSLPLSYSSALQTLDFGAPQTSLSVNLYQVSPALSLRGFPLAIAA